MGLWLPRGVANPARRVLPNRRIGGLLLPSCCSGSALCVRGLAVWQIARYQQGIRGCAVDIKNQWFRTRQAMSLWQPESGLPRRALPHVIFT